jgi:hypothetical protein
LRTQELSGEAQDDALPLVLTELSNTRPHLLGEALGDRELLGTVVCGVCFAERF